MNRRITQSGCRAAFTLIELLVVIAIISLLVSILLPSLTKAKDLARTTMCLTQWRGIGLADQMYAEDYGGYLPSPYDTSIPRGWAGTLEFGRYAENEKLFQDPGCNGETHPRWGTLIDGYGMNTAWIDQSKSPYGKYCYDPQNVQAPSEEVVHCDNRGIWAVGPLLDIFEPEIFPPIWGGGDPLNAMAPRMATRHQGTPNVLFLDWHAEHIPYELAREWSDYWYDSGWAHLPQCWHPGMNTDNY